MRTLLAAIVSSALAVSAGTVAAQTEQDRPTTGKSSEILSTDSGLRYQVLEEGSGDSPTLSDRVLLHYRGWLEDGTKWMDTYERGAPIEFPVAGVMPGWAEAMSLLKEKGTYIVWFPPHLAYGESGRAGLIPPNATIVFDFELLEVRAGKGSPPGTAN